MSSVPVKIDFQLNWTFTPLEKAVFYLVCTGVCDVHAISDLLFIFSEDTVAAALEKLIHAQIVNMNLETGAVALTPQVRRLIALGAGEGVSIIFPEDLLGDEGACLIQRRNVVGAILGELEESPEIRTLAKSIELMVIREDAE